MTQAELTTTCGVRALREVSPTTTVVEFSNGSVRPATGLEKLLWDVVQTRLTAGSSAG